MTPQEQGVEGCTHRTQHRHGTRVAYVADRCRCNDCRTANREYNRHLTRTNLYGRSRLTDAGPARRHIVRLQAAGIGTRQIAALAGISRGQIQAILSGRSGVDARPRRGRIAIATEQAILGARVTRPAPHTLVDAIGARRRLQALVATGWSQARLARQLEVSTSLVQLVIHGRSERVYACTDTAVRALYNDCWNHRPTTRVADRARRLAVREGWAPPLAWDDDTIDDPHAEPEGMATGNQHGRTSVEDVLWLRDQGESLAAIGMRLGIQPESLSQALYRADDGGRARKTA